MPAADRTPPPQHRMAALGQYMETMEAAAAHAQRLCRDQPGQQEVRTALLGAEQQVHRAGWDEPPRVFFLQRHTGTGCVRYAESKDFSRIVIEMPERPAEVLSSLAGVVELIREQVRTPADQLHPALRNLPPVFRKVMSRARLNPDGDLLGGGKDPRWRFHGVGFLFEAWMVLSPNDADWALADEHALYTHRERIESRQLYFSGRDGWNWEVWRLRRTDTIAVPRYCTATNHDSDLTVTGDVPHALARMCNAIASNPVPVMPTDNRYRD